MNVSELSKILETQIPLSKAMGIIVSRCSVPEGVGFQLPLSPNRNHKQTAFGGTLVAAQALASWAWIMALLKEENLPAEVVLQRQFSEFLRPVNKDFKVETLLVPDDEILHFLQMLKRHGKGRIQVTAHVLNVGSSAAVFSGEYVALLAKKEKKK